MIGQATAHRRANAFAQAIEDAGLDGGYEEAPGDPGAPADAVADGHGPGARGPDSGAGGGAGAGGRSAAADGPGGGPGGSAGGGAARGSHAADRHADPEQVTMVALAAAIGRRPQPAMDPERKTVQRAQLIAAMEQAIADGSFRATTRVPEQRGESGRRAAGLRKLTPRSRLTRRLAVGGLTMGVAAGALGGVAAASTNALPGDNLYGLKRSMEDLKLDMAGNDASRGKVYLDMASTRMQEARRLMDRGRGGRLDPESVGEVRKALSGMHQEASEGHRLLTEAYRKDGSLQPMELLNTFADSHRQSWADLRGTLPVQLTDVSEQVSSLFDAIDAEVAPLSLPHRDDHGSSGDRGTGSPRSGRGSGTPGGAGPSGSPSATATTSGPAGADSGQSPTPSPSGSVPDGLIGGSGDLLHPPTATPDEPGATPTETPTSPHHSVELPPLLPGLLPGLGLSTDDDDN